MDNFDSLIISCRSNDINIVRSNIVDWLKDEVTRQHPQLKYDITKDYILFYSYTHDYLKLYTSSYLHTNNISVVAMYLKAECYGWIEVNTKSSSPEKLKSFCDRFLKEITHIHESLLASKYYTPYVFPCKDANLYWLASIMDLYRSLRTNSSIDLRKVKSLKMELMRCITNKYPKAIIRDNNKSFEVNEFVITCYPTQVNERYIIFTCNKLDFAGEISPKLGTESLTEFYSKLFELLETTISKSTLTSLNTYLPTHMQTSDENKLLAIVESVFQTSLSIQTISLSEK